MAPCCVQTYADVATATSWAWRNVQPASMAAQKPAVKESPAPTRFTICMLYGDLHAGCEQGRYAVVVYDVAAVGAAGEYDGLKIEQTF